MQDVAALLGVVLLAGNIGCAIVYDEYDPRNPALQLLIENMPERKRWVIEATYKVNHRVKLTLFQKPIRYAEADIAAAKAAFYSVRNTIDQVLAKNKFIIPGITNLDLTGGWDDKDSLRVGRGTKGMGTVLESRGGGDIAITFRSEQTVTAIYYTTGFEPLSG